MSNVLPLKSDVGQYLESDFCVSPSNIDAYNMVVSNLGDGFICLKITGANSTGKTHLAHIWQLHNKAVFLADGAEFINANIIIEDIENKSQDWLFNIYNSVRNAGKKLLVTCGDDNFEITTPDLTSRLNGAANYHIKQVDDELLLQIAFKEFASRQLIVGKNIVEYIINRVDRNIDSVINIVNKIDAVALQHKRNITIPFIREFIL